jgi:ankyrin repeat protein
MVAAAPDASTDGVTIGHSSGRPNSGRTTPTPTSWLIEKGADVNAKSNDGITPLMCASLSGFSDAVAILLRWGANPKEPDLNGKKARDRAIEQKHGDIAELLRAAGG